MTFFRSPTMARRIILGSTYNFKNRNSKGGTLVLIATIPTHCLPSTFDFTDTKDNLACAQLKFQVQIDVLMLAH